MIIVQTNKEAATTDYLASFALGFCEREDAFPSGAASRSHLVGLTDDPDLITTLFKDELPTIIFTLKLIRK